MKGSSIQVGEIVTICGSIHQTSQIEFNTTYSTGFKQTNGGGIAIGVAINTNTKQNNQSIGGNSSSDQEALATTATTTFRKDQINLSSTGGSTNYNNNLAFLKLP